MLVLKLDAKTEGVQIGESTIRLRRYRGTWKMLIEAPRELGISRIKTAATGNAADGQPEPCTHS